MNNNQKYILINKHLLQRSELKLMMKCQNRAELFGIYMMMVLHLSEADKAIGDDDDIELIHRLCGKYKKSIHDVINHYGLFDVDGERGEFQCRLLRRTMRISTSLGMDDDATDDTKRKKSRRKVRENPEEISNFTTLIVPARDNNNNNNNILNTNETTSSSDIQGDDDDGVDCKVMDHFISDVFGDKVWMETVDDTGQRYGPHGEEVERHAVPCVDPMTRYNIHTHHWEFCKKRPS